MVYKPTFTSLGGPILHYISIFKSTIFSFARHVAHAHDPPEGGIPTLMPLLWAKCGELGELGCWDVGGRGYGVLLGIIEPVKTKCNAHIGMNNELYMIIGEWVILLDLNRTSGSTNLQVLTELLKLQECPTSIVYIVTPQKARKASHFSIFLAFTVVKDTRIMTFIDSLWCSKKLGSRASDWAKMTRTYWKNNSVSKHTSRIIPLWNCLVTLVNRWFQKLGW